MKLKELYYLSESEIIIEIEYRDGQRKRLNESITAITTYGDDEILSIRTSPDGRIIAII